MLKKPPSGDAISFKERSFKKLNCKSCLIPQLIYSIITWAVVNAPLLLKWWLLGFKCILISIRTVAFKEFYEENMAVWSLPAVIRNKIWTFKSTVAILKVTFMYKIFWRLSFLLWAWCFFSHTQWNPGSAFLPY